MSPEHEDLRASLLMPLQRVLHSANAAEADLDVEVLGTGAGPLVRLGLPCSPTPALRRAVEACVVETLATPLPARVVYEIGRSL